MKCNKSMKTLLESDKSGVSAKDLMLTEKRVEKLFKDMAFENGCLFLKTHNGKASSVERSSTRENVSDKVEFEARHNEVLINSEFPKRSITPTFAMQFFAQFNARLQSEYSERICAIVSEDDERWSYRFHIVREGEPLWISEDLEKFAQPIMYDIFGGEDDEL